MPHDLPPAERDVGYQRVEPWEAALVSKPFESLIQSARPPAGRSLSLDRGRTAQMRILSRELDMRPEFLLEILVPA
jgi:hypothetical protein